MFLLSYSSLSMPEADLLSLSSALQKEVILYLLVQMYSWRLHLCVCVFGFFVSVDVFVARSIANMVSIVCLVKSQC